MTEEQNRPEEGRLAEPLLGLSEEELDNLERDQRETLHRFEEAEHYPTVIQLGPEEMELCRRVAEKRYEYGEAMREEYATPEENALEELLEKLWEELSEPARRVYGEAVDAAYAEHLVHNVCYQPEEYEEAMQRMRDALDEATDRDMELLKSVWIAQLKAAVSIDPDDERPAGHKVDRGDLHDFYRMASGMIEEALYRKRYNLPANVPAS